MADNSIDSENQQGQNALENIMQENQLLREENEQVIAVNKQLTLQVEELSDALAKQPAPPPANVVVSTQTFTRNGIQYAFAFPKLSTKHGVITAAEVLASEALQDELIAKKSGFIKPI